MKAKVEAVAAATEDRLLPVAAVAALLGVSARTVWKMGYAGKLPAPVRVGRAVRWRASDVQVFIADGCTVERGR